jgi:hypothetical protein
VIYHEKRPKKLKTRETKYVEINNIVYMELYLGAKMVNEKDLKTKYLRLKNREFTVHKLEKIFAGVKGNKKYPARSVKCVLHIRREVKLVIFINSALFCFTMGLVSRNTIK